MTSDNCLINKKEKMSDLENALEEGKDLMKKFINNDIELVLKRLKEKADVSLIHALGLGAVRVFECLLTLDKSSFRVTIESLKGSCKFSNSLRKKSYANFILSPDYNTYSDQECLAELCYAKSLLLWGLVTVLDDQSFFGAINGGLKIRASHQAYKECLNLLKLKTNWDSNLCRMHFESGTRLGIGAFELFVSLFPSKMAKLLEFVGFGNNRTVALKELNISVKLIDGLLYEASSILLSTYYGFLEYFYGLGEGNFEFFDQSSKIWLSRTLDSPLVKLGLGIGEMIMGKPNQALEHYKHCIQAQSYWTQLNYACYWKMAWCFAMKKDWTEATRNAKFLKDNCKWSPAMFTYLYAVFLFMVMEENNQPELKQEISENFRKIPTLKRKIGGKRAFHEKIVTQRSKKYENKVEQLLLPPLELFYIWNIFNMLGKNPSLIEPFLKNIKFKLKTHKNDKTKLDEPLDKYLYLTFIKGVCYRHLNIEKAMNCFNKIVKYKTRIKEEVHLIPQAYFEIGLIYRNLGQFQNSKIFLKKACHDHSGYLTETMIQYRVQCALASLQ